LNDLELRNDRRRALSLP